MKKNNLKIDTMSEPDLQRVYKTPTYPKISKKYSDKGFGNIDNGITGGTHWTCFIVKNNKSYYFDSFGGKPDKHLPKHLPKPIIYHKCNLQDIYSKLCGSYCLYFVYLIERMKDYDTFLKMYFEKL